MILTSRLLNAVPRIRHGFSTRLGGVSKGPFASMNLGLDVDERPSVLENRRRFAQAIGLEDSSHIIQVDQVHGTRVLDAREAEGAEADGLISFLPRVCVGVRTADCAPVLIACQKSDGQTAVAAVHGGWRGATAQIVGSAVSILNEQGFATGDMIFAIGPTIGLQSFEVGEEVIEAARASLGGKEPKTMTSDKGTQHLDLVDVIAQQLLNLGVAPERIEAVGGCTYENPAMFFSHRREHGKTGRHLSAIYFDEG